MLGLSGPCSLYFRQEVIGVSGLKAYLYQAEESVLPKIYPVKKKLHKNAKKLDRYCKMLQYTALDGEELYFRNAA